MSRSVVAATVQLPYSNHFYRVKVFMVVTAGPMIISTTAKEFHYSYLFTATNDYTPAMNSNGGQATIFVFCLQAIQDEIRCNAKLAQNYLEWCRLGTRLLGLAMMWPACENSILYNHTKMQYKQLTLSLFENILQDQTNLFVTINISKACRG